jgi:Protein of unknown function (DUF998)
LEPKKNPDIFSIGSKWPYKSKRVTFITDIDSISFDVQPGNKYDFLILQGNIRCHIQIRTLNDPVLLHTKAIILLLLCFLGFITILYFYRDRIDARDFLRLGYGVVILFWIMTFISGYVHGNYNHFKNTISELGAISTKSETFTSSALLFIAALNILFCIGFYKESKSRKISLIPSVLSFAMPVSMIWAGVFTLGNALPFLIVLGCILSYFLWKSNNNLQGLRTVSLISFSIMILVLTRFIKPFGYEFEGLVQRFFYFGWTIWTIGVSYFLSQAITR